MVKYCDFVLELFGSFALERHIRLEDFQKKEKKWLQKGYVQLMPFRDQSGRRIILQIIDSNVLMEQITRLKLYHYTAMVATEDVESQRRGVVLVVWPGGAGKDWSKRQLPDKRARHLVTRRHEVIPMRYAGYHYCMPEIPVFRLVRAFAVLYVIRSEIKSRMKFHIGEDLELRYELRGYGIPVEFIPVTGTGNIKTNYLRQWIHVRKIVEAEARYNGNIAVTGRSTSARIVECPGSSDVIFKPGKRMVCHPGNALFQQLIVSKASEYTSTSSKRGLYRWLSREIVEKRGGRFLKWNDDGYWTEIEDEAQITIKISTACKAVLNKMKKSARASKNERVVDSSTHSFNNNNGGSSAAPKTEEICCEIGGNSKRKRSTD